MTTDKMPANISAVCGSLLSITVSLNSGELIKSVILGVIGTLVSYWVSRILKALFG
jgi:hypothetical protein